MKQLVPLILIIGYLPAFGQIAVTGSSGSNTVANYAPAVVVDAALLINTSYTIPAFIVRVSANFNSGDVLGYTGSLPSGVTASYASGTGILTFTGSTTALNYQTLLRTVTFNTTSSNTSTRTITFEAGDGTITYYSSNGHYYNYVVGTFNWIPAKTDAAGKNLFGQQGYLVTITSVAENTVVLGLSGRGWIGASDSYTQINTATGTTTYASQAASEGKWYWVTGPEKGTLFSNGSSAVTYASWTSGEPSNSSSLEHYAENVQAVAGTWNDTQNSGSSGYVIEYGGTSGDPTVDLYHTRNMVMVATELKTQTSSTGYSLHAPAILVDPAITLYSTSSITDAKVTISGNFYSGDVLSYTGTLPSGVTVSGTGYNSATGVLSFSGTTTPANWQALFRTVKFNSASNSVGNRDITFSVGNLVAFSNGHFYESITTGAPWTTSKSISAAKTYLGLQGYLATITSTAENDFIKQKIGTDAWIGSSDSYLEINAATGVTTYANQAASEGKWYWVTGPEKGTQITTANATGSGTGPAYAGAFNNWNAGEPNNYAGDESYGEIYASGSALGKWNDLNGTANLMYVVEYGGTSTDPALALTANTTIFNNSILPASGLDFSAQPVMDVIDLKWSTLSEINCDHFDILHSDDGINYKRIGSLKGNGTTYTKQLYQFVDSAPAYGINFYKLQQFDIDNRYKYSQIRQVNYGNTQTLLCPNPAHAKVTIFNTTADNNNAVMIYNMSGKIMGKTKIESGKAYVDIQTYPVGLYFAVIKDKLKSTRIMFVKN
jgi:hypothetical protein